MFSLPVTTMAEVHRNETVYVNLNHDGSVKEVKIVTHLSGDSKGEYYIDYGKLEAMKVLTNGIEPVIDNETLKWNTSDLRENDIYYEGRIQKELPLDIQVQYFIDGTEINGEALAGKSGTLEIRVDIKNSNELTTQIQVPLNLDTFTNIEAKSGVASVVGKTMTIVFTHLPIGDQSFSIKADGKNIELDPITISSIKSSMSLGENLEGDIEAFSDGMTKMSDATRALENGSRELLKGTNLLKEGLKVLSTGLSKFLSGLKEIGTNLKTLVEGFSQFNMGLGQLNENIPTLVNGLEEISGGINTLSLQSNNIENGIKELDNGTKDLAGGLGQLSDGLEELNMGHSNLTGLAQDLLASSDPRVKALAEGVIDEAQAIEELNKGAGQFKAGMDLISQNTSNLSYGYEEYNKGLKSIASGFNQMNNEAKQIPTRINEMYQGHSQLVGGLSSLYEGLNTAIIGGDELNINAVKVPVEVEKLVEGQNKLTDGITQLNNEGFEKITEGIDKFSMLGSFQDDTSYTSFVDERNSENSNCQFIMQTAPIKVEPIKVKSEANVEAKKSIFQRFIDLFSRFFG